MGAQIIKTGIMFANMLSKNMKWGFLFVVAMIVVIFISATMFDSGVVDDRTFAANYVYHPPRTDLVGVPVPAAPTRDSFLRVYDLYRPMTLYAGSVGESHE